MKFLTILALSVAQIAIAIAQSVSIAVPSTGAQWVKGDKANIEWTYSSDFQPSQFKSVSVDLMQGTPGQSSKAVMHIYKTLDMPYAGVAFQVPNDLAAGNNYFVQLNVETSSRKFNVQGQPITVVEHGSSGPSPNPAPAPGPVVVKSDASAQQVLTFGAVALSAVTALLL